MTNEIGECKSNHSLLRFEKGVDPFLLNELLTIVCIWISKDVGRFALDTGGDFAHILVFIFLVNILGDATSRKVYGEYLLIFIN